MKTSRRTLLKNSAAAAATLSLDWRYASAQAETVRIGVIFDHSGPFAAGGSVASSIGTQIAIDLCNERGGVAGKYKVVPVNADLQSKADAAINEVERLINQEKVDIIDGVYSSAHAVPLAAKVEQQKKILWITTAVATAVFKDKNLKYVFRAQIHSDQYGQAFAGFITENAKAKLGVEPTAVKVALIHEDGPYGVGVAAADEEYSKKAGLNIVMREGYSAAAPDLSALVTKLKRAAPDVISHVGYNPDITLFLRQARESGLRFKMLIGAGAGYSQLDKLRATFGKDIDNFCNIDPVPAQLLDPKNSRPASASSPTSWWNATKPRRTQLMCRHIAQWGSIRPGFFSTVCCRSQKRNTAASTPNPSVRRPSMSILLPAEQFRATALSSFRPAPSFPDRMNVRRRSSCRTPASTSPWCIRPTFGPRSLCCRCRNHRSTQCSR